VYDSLYASQEQRKWDGVTATQFKVDSRMCWFVLWSAMLVISASNAVLSYPVFTGNLAMIFSTGLAGIAGVQLLVGAKFLPRKNKLLAANLIILFWTAQMVYKAEMVGPAGVRGFDFSAYYVAAHLLSERPIKSPYDNQLYPDGRLVLYNGKNITPRWGSPAYRYRVPYQVSFIYPPITAVLMKPFARLSFESALRLWNLLTLVAVAGSILFGLSLGGVNLNAELALVLGVGLFSYYPFQWDLIYGQVGCFILLLTAASLWLLSKNRTSMSALGFAAATLIKLTPVLAVPVLVFHRRWRWLLAYGGSLLSLAGLSVWQAGWAIHRQFVHQVLPSLACGTPICLNTSITAVVQQIFIGGVPNWRQPLLTLPPHACNISRAVAGAVYVILLFRFFRKRADADLVKDLMLMAILTITISPLSWWHHYTLAIVPLLYLWCKMPERGNVLLATFVLVIGTNIVGFCQLLATNHLCQVILSGIVPAVTLALVWQQLSRKQRMESREGSMAAGSAEMVLKG
jgi:Glycosyltransferase family 87